MSRLAKEFASLFEGEGFEERPQQLEMAEAVAETLERGELLCVEAPTGVGKSLAYLLPLLRYASDERKRVAISTETRALQKQILDRDIPLLSDKLGLKLRAELCMGSANYLCLKRAASSFEETRHGRALKRLADWAQRPTSSGLRFDYPGEVENELWRLAARDRDSCPGRRCDLFEDCGYFRSRERWRQAHLLIVNHSLLSSQIGSELKILPEFSALVIDEAHRFPESYAASRRSALSLHELNRRFGDPKQPVILREELDSAFQLWRAEMERELAMQPRQLRRLYGQMSFQSAFAFSQILEREQAAGKELLNEMLGSASDDSNSSGTPGSIEKLLSDEESGGPESEEARQLLQYLLRNEQTSRLITALIDGPGSERVHWVESRPLPNEELDLLFFISPLQPGAELPELLWGSLDAAILTSATLSSGTQEPFAFFQRQLGLAPGSSRGEDVSGRVTEKQLDSPFDYAGRVALYLPGNLPDPGRDDKPFHEAVAAEMVRLVELSGGGAFLLFTSLRALREVSAMIEPRLTADGYTLLRQDLLGAQIARDRFLQSESEKMVLLGVATFWQGIDVPGDQLRLVAIARIPFQVPDDPLLEAQTEIEKSAGRNPFMSLQLPFATIQIKQGFGRLMRRKSDRGVVALLDPRLKSRRYGEDILRLLPPAPRIEQFEELKEFWNRLFSADT